MWNLFKDLQELAVDRSQYTVTIQSLLTDTSTTLSKLTECCYHLKIVKNIKKHKTLTL